MPCIFILMAYTGKGKKLDIPYPTMNIPLVEAYILKSKLNAIYQRQYWKSPSSQ